MLAPIRVQDVYSLVQQMIHSPADQVRLGSQLRNMVQSLPPPHNELISRYRFARAGLWSYAANFFEVGENLEPPVEVIEMPHDSWIRSVQAFALPRLDPDYVAETDLDAAARQRKLLGQATGTNFRGLVELNWRINARQGFISSGTGEVQSPATMIAGDGLRSADVDWRLQKQDTIEVRARSRVGQIFAPSVEPAIDRTLAWVCVIFWAEELPQP